MKKNGFTLVEILAVLILISLLAIISIPSILKYLNQKDDEISEVTSKLIFTSSELYADKDKDRDKLKQQCVLLEDVVNEGFLEAPIIDVVNNKEISLKKFVKITFEYNEDLKKDVKNYELVDNCSEILFVCLPVDNNTKTFGNIPSGKYEYGDEYICEVKSDTEYHFFVLSNEEDSINLILDRNINSDGTLATERIEQSGNNVYNTMEWISLDDYTKAGGAEDKFGEHYSDKNSENNRFGPITAMNFLENATNDWENIPRIEMIYNDLNGHYENFEIYSRARLPKVEEVAATGCYVIDPTKTEDYQTKTGTCPVWLANYLHDFNDVLQEGYENYVEGRIAPEYEGLIFINNIHGYWTMDSYEGDGFSARNNDNLGYTETSACATSSYYGVRPVITIPKDFIKK